MSYDVSLMVDGSEVDYGNYTSNCAPMWREAGCDLQELDQQTAAAAIKALAPAIAAMATDPQKYQAMEPGNGWGTYFGCLLFLTKILAACIEHPNAIVEVGW